MISQIPILKPGEVEKKKFSTLWPVKFKKFKSLYLKIKFYLQKGTPIPELSVAAFSPQ